MTVTKRSSASRAWIAAVAHFWAGRFVLVVASPWATAIAFLNDRFAPNQTARPTWLAV